MKKRNVFLLGLLVALLAMGLVLAGCDDGSGKKDNNSGNTGDNTGGNGTLNIRFGRDATDGTGNVTTITTPSIGYHITLYIYYQDSQGNWDRADGNGFSYQWSKNGSVISNPQGATLDFISLADADHCPNDSIGVKAGDKVSVKVTHSDGRTGTRTLTVF